MVSGRFDFTIDILNLVENHELEFDELREENVLYYGRPVLSYIAK